MTKTRLVAILAILLPHLIFAQERLTIEQCRQLALENNNALAQERIKVEMAGIDRKIAASNYFPDISIKGGYLHNGDDISLISKESSSNLRNLGNIAQKQISGKLDALKQAIMSNPQAAAEYMGSQMWQTVLKTLSQTDITEAFNFIGNRIDNALNIDMRNISGGAISLRQPVFMGGKIVASNRIARMAEELAQSRYDERHRQIIIDADNAYWQTVSISAKKKLAGDYSGLLQKMLSDALAAVDEGVATEAEALSIKVKANEASIMYTKAENGLKLSKMLLCKQIGLPLDKDIVLADEGVETISPPFIPDRKPIDEICDKRPEMRQLKLAEKIYTEKVTVARADMLPSLALTANYIYTNPNFKNGFEKSGAWTWNAGVMLKIPLVHGMASLQKTHKAKAEASLYGLQYKDVHNMIELQVTQLRCQAQEAQERLAMTQSNLESAQENLRAAMAGFEEGLVPANTAMAAQTAWLSAHSEYIDACIELQIIALNINKAEGNIL